MTYTQAVKKADKRAQETGSIRFVVYDLDEIGAGKTFHVATEEDLETWFAGIHPDNIRYSTEDGEYCD